MRISINGISYEIPRAYEEKLMDDLLTEGKQEYGKLKRAWRVLAMPFTRGILQGMEEHIAKQEGKEAARAIRPEKGADPNLHLAFLFSRLLLEGLKHVELYICTTEGTIDTFNLVIESPGQAGGQVGTDRHVGLRENDSTQVP